MHRRRASILAALPGRILHGIAALVVLGTMTPLPALAQASLAEAGAWVCGTPRWRETASETAAGYQPSAADRMLPWMAKLEILEQRLEGGSFLKSNCGAAALDRHWLITAAHCVASNDWLSVRVTLGSRDLDAGGAVRRSVAVALCHEGFDPSNLDFDLALLRLDQPLPSTFPTLRVATSYEIDQLRPNQQALSAGWARSGGSKKGTQMSRVLSRRYLRLVDPARSGFTGGAARLVAAPQADEPSLCLGDSGGPLVADVGDGPSLVGVFSNVDALVDPATGEVTELCEGFEARSYFTSLSGLHYWLDATRRACAYDPAACGD
ncbi:MAG: trypsin-like serine protease [Pseudomonadota bacterium]